MYCSFYKGDPGNFSISIDADEAGIELLTVMKNVLKRQITERINLDQFEKCQRLLNIADEVDEALADAQAPKEDERAEDQPEDAGE